MNKKKIIGFLCCLILLILSTTFAFGKYVYNFVRDYYLEAKGFYFNSTTMSVNGSNHNINNWDGVNAYTINIDLNSMKNIYLKMDEDIEYDITYNCSSNVICEVNKTSGTIYTATSTDTYTITITPVTAFQEGEKAVITTSATSRNPYVKTLSTTYNVGIEVFAFSYEIKDEVGQKYLELELNNAFPYYQVEVPFDSYSVGDYVSIDEYNNLSPTNQNKVKSVNLTLGFNPNNVLLDLTDNTYIKRGYNVLTTPINGHQYVNSFAFKMKANETIKILFYKTNSNMDYSNANIFQLTIDKVS